MSTKRLAVYYVPHYTPVGGTLQAFRLPISALPGAFDVGATKVWRMRGIVERIKLSSADFAIFRHEEVAQSHSQTVSIEILMENTSDTVVALTKIPSEVTPSLTAPFKGAKILVFICESPLAPRHPYLNVRPNVNFIFTIIGVQSSGSNLKKNDFD